MPEQRKTSPCQPAGSADRLAALETKTSMDPYNTVLVERQIALHAESKLPRPKRFEYLSALGLRTPLHGTVQQVVEQISSEWMLTLTGGAGQHMFHTMFDLMVYGEHSRVMPMGLAIKQAAGAYYCEFIPPGSRSWSYMQVGIRRWWLQWDGPERSDSHLGTCQILGEEEPGYHPRISLPTFAIECIPGQYLWAIDFDPAPELNDTPLVSALTPAQYADLIEGALRRPQPR